MAVFNSIRQHINSPSEERRPNHGDSIIAMEEELNRRPGSYSRERQRNSGALSPIPLVSPAQFNNETMLIRQTPMDEEYTTQSFQCAAP